MYARTLVQGHDRFDHHITSLSWPASHTQSVVGINNITSAKCVCVSHLQEGMVSGCSRFDKRDALELHVQVVERNIELVADPFRDHDDKHDWQLRTTIVA
jgi:hypothetical protein